MHAGRRLLRSSPAGRQAGRRGAQSAPMRHSHRPSRRRDRPTLRAIVWGLGGAVALLGVWLIVSAGPAANAAGSGPLKQKLSTIRQKVSNLAGDVAAAKATRSTSSTPASRRSRAGWPAFRVTWMPSARSCCGSGTQLTAAQARLRQLEWTVAVDQQALAQQLVGSYEGARPDIVDVVLEATGFNDLLERLAFAQRIGQQDARIVGNVKAARRAVSAEAIRLGSLSARQNRLTEQALSDRDQVARLRLRLVSQRLAAARAESAKAGQLAGARDQVASLTKQLASLQAAAAAPPTPSTSGTSGGGSSGGARLKWLIGLGGGPTAPASRGFEFPMPKGDVSPPATWSSTTASTSPRPAGRRS